MQKHTRSILEELNNIARTQDTNHLVESAGNNIIESAINFISRLYNTYDEETALDLERRMISSIRSGDPKKFNRGIRRIDRS